MNDADESLQANYIRRHWEGVFNLLRVENSCRGLLRGDFCYYTFY